MTNDVLGKDIKLISNDITFSNNQDFQIITGDQNLAQAIKNRLSTVMGEYVLTDDYGSKINRISGYPAAGYVESAVQGYLTEALNMESRIRDYEINDIVFKPDINKVTIDIDITPITQNQPFNFVYPLYV